ncbi:lysophospholipid acyltransferase family protein [Lignipirellula cremea]|uniref:1-acyl-sn-glycerol-3-phosphate acyltransferase n=1 Tax=Lignipirellula cremea TaxID=2528010 RepID=A0A518E142_9BACT|nr:lysophospholipid acyltransferase family protein [Lignipirellula cremea]QDU97810.1 1-acyl-sn-glycerol-3-phosphate acyltransferase [Lignipirellula cremea]
MTTLQSALLFFALLACVLAAALWRLYARSPYNLMQSALYFVNVLLTRFLWRTRFPDPLPLPTGQGAVIVSNHRSSVDPFFVQLAAGRVVHWMVAREYVVHPAFGWFLRACQVIPVRRTGVDTAATKAAIRYASQGGVIGVFPEGRINMTDAFLLPCRPGAAMIAIKAGVPLIPCYIEGSPYNQTPWSPFFMTAKVRVQFGEPISVAGCDERNSEQLQTVMLACLSQITRLAGRLDVQPKLAGKKWMASRQQIEADMALSEQRNRRPPRKQP